MIAAGYQPKLSTPEIVACVEAILLEQRQGEWLICRYLADLADGDRWRELGWASDFFSFVRRRFGLGVKTTRERIRIGRALRNLPAIEHAFIARKISYSKVREITRVATPANEGNWLAAALRLSTRELERRVVMAMGPNGKQEAKIRTRWTTPETIEVRMNLPAATWALIQRAMEGARIAAGGGLSETEALEAVAREALARQTLGGEVDPRRAVVVYECASCKSAELETNAGAIPLPPEQAAQLCCGAKSYDLRTEGTSVTVGGAMPASVRRAVILRDRARCRVPGCGRRVYVDVHHLHHQAKGGEHSRRNCATLCTTCHTALHEGKLRVEGNADGELRWYDEHGHRIVEEGAPQLGRPEVHEDAQRILRTMGDRGGWQTERLLKETGSSVQRVLSALTNMEVSGMIVQEVHGWRAKRADEKRRIAPIGTVMTRAALH